MRPKSTAKADAWAAWLDRVEHELELHGTDGATSALVAAHLEARDDRVRHTLNTLAECGRAVRVPLSGRGGGGKSIWRYYAPGVAPRPQPIATPAPAPSQATARYCGEIVRGPVGQMSPERVEYRTVNGQRVKVTICPAAIEPPRFEIPSVPRVRVNLSSQWGGL